MEWINPNFLLAVHLCDGGKTLFRVERHLNTGQSLFCSENSSESKGKQIIYHSCQLPWHPGGGFISNYIIFYIVYFFQIHFTRKARSRKQIKTYHLSPASGVFPNPLSVCSTPCLQSHDSSLLLAVGGRRGQVSSSECATFFTMYVQSIIVFTCSIEMHLSYIYIQNHTIHLYCGESSFIPESCHSAIYLY